MELGVLRVLVLMVLCISVIYATAKSTTRPTTKATRPMKKTIRPTTKTTRSTMKTTRPTTKTTRPTTKTTQSTIKTTKSTTPYYKSSTTRRPTSTTTSRYSYYYMDDSSDQCGPFSYNYLEKRSYIAYVEAWGTSRTYHPYSCTLTFVSYAADGIKYKFSSIYYNYIDSCSVTLNVYSGSSTLSPLVGKYTCFNKTIPTLDNYVSSGELTFELLNPTGRTDFDFKIQVSSSYEHDSKNAGLIAGLTVGCFFFAVFIFVVACASARARRRRFYRQRNALIAAQTAVVVGDARPANYGTNYQHPPPPVGSYQTYPTAPPPYYQQPSAVPPPGVQPPVGAAHSQAPPMSNTEQSGYPEKPAPPSYGVV